MIKSIRLVRNKQRSQPTSSQLGWALYYRPPGRETIYVHGPYMTIYVHGDGYVTDRVPPLTDPAALMKVHKNVTIMIADLEHT